VSRSPVQSCAEFRRIDELPRRTVSVDDDTIDRVSQMLLRPGLTVRRERFPGDPEALRLRPIQVQALLECAHLGGLLGPIRVGAGKTLISFLAPTICGAERPVLLVPAKLRGKTIAEYVEAARTWRVHPRLIVDSYNMQSRPDHAERLLAYWPDFLELDEAHALKSPQPAVTQRITKYVEAKRPRVVVLSGTLIRGDIKDAAHLSAWALGAGSPFPRTWRAQETWGAVLDQKREPAECTGREAGVLSRWADGSTIVADLRRGFRDRVASTPGVIATHDAGPDIPLTLERWTPSSTPELDAAVAELATTWQLPDGRDLEDPLRQTDALNTLALGFWYRWRVEPPARWLHTRRLWAWFVRQTITRTELDSVETVARACRAGTLDVPTIGELLTERDERQDADGVWWVKSDKPVRWDVDPTARISDAWAAVAPTFEPESETVWLTDTIAQQAAQWAKQTGGIVWTQFAPFGRALDALGVPYYGAGGLREGVMIERASGPICASIAANSEGRNLQKQWSRNLVTAVRAGKRSAAGLEQLIARTHRDGSTAESVHVSFMLVHEHQNVALAKVLNGARFLEQTTGQPQKLTIAVNATGV
jgi:hypothetical protein